MLNRGPQRQEQKQPLNTLASNVLFIYKTKNPAVAVKREEGRGLMVTGQPKHDYVTFQNAPVIIHTSVNENNRIIKNYLKFIYLFIYLLFKKLNN